MNELFEEYRKQDKPLFDLIEQETNIFKEYMNNSQISENNALCWKDVDNNYHQDNDLPAWIFNGNDSECAFMRWYQHGKLHRNNDKPAIVWDYGCEWWVNGLRHREKGPAILEATKYDTGENLKQWFLFGQEYTEDEFNAIQEKKHLDKKIDQANLLTKTKFKL